MLPARHRLRDPEDFRATSRHGRRAGSRSVVVHLLRPSTPQVVDVSPSTPEGTARIGWVVSRAVGTAVVRNRVKRRLRHAMAERITGLEAGMRVVVRAQPAAATASYEELVADLDRCLNRVLTAEHAGQTAHAGHAGQTGSRVRR